MDDRTARSIIAGAAAEEVLGRLTEFGGALVRASDFPAGTFCEIEDYLVLPDGRMFVRMTPERLAELKEEMSDG